jgi:predicted ester cyclase
MSVAQNKASIRRSTDELWNKGNLAVIPELVAPDYIFHTVMEIKGPEGYGQYVTMVRTAFPDWNETTDYMAAEADMVAAFYTIKGTFKNGFMGMTPTGKKFTINTVCYGVLKVAKWRKRGHIQTRSPGISSWALNLRANKLLKYRFLNCLGLLYPSQSGKTSGPPRNNPLLNSRPVTSPVLAST